MSIDIRRVETRADLKRFIHLPAKIHKNHSNWIPPLYGDDWAFFDPKKNQLFEHCDHVYYLAYKEDQLVGRIMGLIHHEYNEAKGENNARFNFLETWDDIEVSEALLQAVMDWAKENGKEKLVGPLAFSDKDPQGYLIEGFDQPMVIASHCNYEYTVKHLEQLGFEKELDLVVYKVPIPEEIPTLHQRIEERAIANNKDLKLIEFKSKRQLKPYIRPIFTLINKTFTGIYGFTPFTPEEMDEFANRYILVMDANYVKAVETPEGEVIAFILGMPDIGDGIRKSKGYLFPIGWIPILTSGKKSKQLNLLLGAIHPNYQNRGLDKMMGNAFLRSAMKDGKEYMDSHLEMETNTKVRAEMEHAGGKVYKKYRIFHKSC